jgi:hypothetical protein
MAVEKYGSATIDRIAGPTDNTAHTVGAGTNRLLVVAHAGWADGPSLTSVTWNTSEALTRWKTYNPDASTVVELWYLIAPTETTANVTVEFSGADSSLAIINFSGVHQTTPIRAGSDDTATNTNGEPTITIDTASGDLVIGAVGAWAEITEDAGNTELAYQTATGGDTRLSVGSVTADAAQETLNWTTTDSWFAVGASLVPATGGGSSTTQEGYRWRLDDGDQANATWAANQDTGITAPVNTTRRLRVIIDTTGDANAATYQLEYKEANDANYTKVS